MSTMKCQKGIHTVANNTSVCSVCHTHWCWACRPRTQCPACNSHKTDRLHNLKSKQAAQERNERFEKQKRDREKYNSRNSNTASAPSDFSGRTRSSGGDDILFGWAGIGLIVLFFLDRITAFYEAHKIATWIIGGILGFLILCGWLGDRLPVTKHTEPLDDSEDPNAEDAEISGEQVSSSEPSYDRWNSSNPFEVLELDASANSDQVRSAFHALIAQYHPDKVASLAPEFRTMADERSKKINWAYAECLKTAPKTNPTKEQQKKYEPATAPRIIEVAQKSDKLKWIWKTPLYLSLIVCFGTPILAALLRVGVTRKDIVGVATLLVISNLFITLPALFLSRFLKRQSHQPKTPESEPHRPSEEKAA